jgi:hypothetical protein
MARVVHLPIVESASCPRTVVFEGTAAHAEDFFYRYCEREDVDEFYVVLEGHTEEEISAARTRLEEIRAAIDAESVSYGELADLEELSHYIEPGDVQLAEWAGIPEQEFHARV